MPELNLGSAPEPVTPEPVTPVPANEPTEADLPTEKDDIRQPAEEAPAEPQTAPKAEESKTPDNLQKANKQLFARAKTAEEVAKAYKEMYGDLPVDGKPAQSSQEGSQTVNTADPIAIARAAQALKDFDEPELEHLGVVARGMNVSPTEAAQSEAFKTFVSGHRETLRKAKAVPASNGVSPAGSGKTEQEIAEMSDAEFQQFEKEARVSQKTQGV